MTERITEELILKTLSTVMDPELNRDLVSLGMIKEVETDGQNVKFTIELTTPACPLRTRIEADARKAISTLPGVESIDIKMSARVQQSQLLKEKLELNIKNIIAISSGKGGVGKTTVAVNLAVALAKSGASVGIMDADIYGPNVPTMMGVKRMPAPQDNKMIPAEAYGVKIISIGFLVKDGQPLIWRGPLLNSAIKQFLTDVDWGNLDYLVVDLPPGTGDVQLSLSQHIPITCGIIVTMPQKVSLDDATRGIEMFKKLEIPIAGVIENMGAMQLPDGTILNVFGEGGGEAMANAYGLSFLARIPLNPEIGINSDAGTPIIVSQPESQIAGIFSSIACEVASYISQHNVK
jgi:ATP-binding protein involved in chromosome partitioning